MGRAATIRASAIEGSGIRQIDDGRHDRRRSRQTLEPFTESEITIFEEFLQKSDYCVIKNPQ